MRYLLGIDLGTSSVRATLLTEDGVIVGSGAKEYPLHFPAEGWIEQDPETWWRATCESITDLLRSSLVSPCDISAIGLAGQMHGLVLLDEVGRCVRPAIIWADKRSTVECEQMKQVLGEDQIYSITGNPIATGFFGPSLLWVMNNEPSVYEKACTALLPKDYIRFRLTGEYATDATDGSGTLLFSVSERNWSQRIISDLGLRVDLLPNVLEPWEKAGSITKSASEETGLKTGTTVSAGGSDQAMGAIGAGIIRQGLVGSVIGTGGQMITASKQAVFDPKQRIHTLCHAQPNTWLLMGAILAGGLSLNWFKQTFGELETLVEEMYSLDAYKMFSLASAKVDAGAQGLIFLPYLAGERTPHMNPRAKGCFIGLTLTHRKEHLIRAVMEGVTFAMKESLTIFYELGLTIESVICSGGGAKSSIWPQIQADIYGLPVSIVDIDEHSSYGAALVAGVTAGIYNNALDIVDSKTLSKKLIEPIRENKVLYQKQYSMFQALYPALEHIFAQMYE